MVVPRKLLLALPSNYLSASHNVQARHKAAELPEKAPDSGRGAAARMSPSLACRARAPAPAPARAQRSGRSAAADPAAATTHAPPE